MFNTIKEKTDLNEEKLRKEDKNKKLFGLKICSKEEIKNDEIKNKNKSLTGSKKDERTKNEGDKIENLEIVKIAKIKNRKNRNNKTDESTLNKTSEININLESDKIYEENNSLCESEENFSKIKNSIKNENYKTGRWEPDEHQRFIEAILKYGNEWKKVQKHVGSRSSTQARSHAQKFFVKIKRTNLFDLNIDLNKSSIKSLQEVANQMNKDQYLNTIKKLNNIAFEKKSSSSVFPNGSGRRKFKFFSNTNINSKGNSHNSNIENKLNATNTNNSFLNSFNSNFKCENDNLKENNLNNTDTNNKYFLGSYNKNEMNKSNLFKDTNEINLTNYLNSKNKSLCNSSLHQNNFTSKSIQLPSNIKIFSKKDDEINNLNTTFYNIDDIINTSGNGNKSIIINNHINNYNINYNTFYQPLNYTQIKRSRGNSLDNIFYDCNFNNAASVRIEEDFSNSFLEYFKSLNNMSNQINSNNQCYPSNSSNLSLQNNLGNSTNEGGIYQLGLNENINEYIYNQSPNIKKNSPIYIEENFLNWNTGNLNNFTQNK